MNFLGHLWLADQTRTSLPGSILGDFVRGPDLSMYPQDIARGIRLHRRADAWIDRHPAFRQARSRFDNGQRKFAGIVLDIALDHALTLEWDRHHERALPDFAEDCGKAIESAGHWFELAGSERPRPRQFAQLLLSYATREGIDRAFARVAARRRRLEDLLVAARDWPDHANWLRDRLPALLDDLKTLDQSAR